MKNLMKTIGTKITGRTTMKTNTELLQVAIKTLGDRGSKYQKYAGLSSGQPWCDAYVYWLFNANGCGALLPWKGNERTSAPYSIKWCEKNLAQIPPYLSTSCDIVYFDWEPNGRPNHVGIVEKHWGVASVHSIEGNTSGGKVARKDRKGYVQAVFRPHFKPAVMPKKEKLVVDGEFGYKSIFMLQVALGLTPDAVLGKGTVKALQKAAGTGQDGAWGKGTTKAVQKLVGVKVDGQWGGDSTKALQKWINKKCFSNQASGGGFTATKSTVTASEPTKAQISAVTASTYKGGFPVFPEPKIIECTRSVNGMRKHGLLSGDYILRFKSEERRYKMCKFSVATVNNKKISYSNQPKFEDKVKKFGYNLAKVKALNTSANCSNFIDGAVGAVTGKYVRDLGAKHNKKYLAKTNFFTSHKYSKGALLAGDICGTPKHTWMIIQPYNRLTLGCEGLNVKRLQAFLNWAGCNCGALDSDFGMKTLAAVKAFQTKVGLTSDGVFGPTTLAKAKAFKK